MRLFFTAFLSAALLLGLFRCKVSRLYFEALKTFKIVFIELPKIFDLK